MANTVIIGGHGKVALLLAPILTARGDTVTSEYLEANQLLNEIDALGIDFDEVTELLETEGLSKFDASWAELVETVDGALRGAA